MNRLLGIAATLSLLLMGGVALADTSSTASTSAQAVVSTPTFPIAELGSCDSRVACHTYCEVASNRDACFTYAQAHGLMSREKVEAAKAILSKKGPGSCDSRDACVAYCTDSSHQDECIAFAQSHKIIAEDKVLLIKKLISGTGPGACKTSHSCRAYCEDPLHGSECRAFAQENGLVRAKMMSSTTPAALRSRAMTASSTPGNREMEMKIKVSSSTPPGLRDMRPGLGSTTRPQERPMMTGSPTRGADMPRPPLPPKPLRQDVSTTSDNMGAMIIRAVAHLMGL